MPDKTQPHSDKCDDKYCEKTSNNEGEAESDRSRPDVRRRMSRRELHCRHGFRNVEGTFWSRTGIRFRCFFRLGAVKLFDWGDQAIAMAGKRFNEARIIRRVAQGF